MFEEFGCSVIPFWKTTITLHSHSYSLLMFRQRDNWKLCFWGWMHAFLCFNFTSVQNFNQAFSQEEPWYKNLFVSLIQQEKKSLFCWILLSLFCTEVLIAFSIYHFILAVWVELLLTSFLIKMQSVASMEHTSVFAVYSEALH